MTETNRGSVRARLTQYRNGAVFENWRTAPDHEGNGIARIEPSETNLVPRCSLITSPTRC
ncbi:MAG: hypothetical protein ACXVQJ_02630 [Actinomycetota bacterium]